MSFDKNLQYYKFSLYGFLKNLRFFDPFLILFFREKGLSFLAIGSLYAIREITKNILEIPTGIIADSIGRRRTMIISFIAYIISFILFYLYNTYSLFVVAMIFFSLGEACRSGTHKAMIFEYLQINNKTDQKVHYYGNTRGWSQMGSALSSLIAAIIVFYSGNLNTIFLFSTIPYILDLILMMTYPKELDGELKKISWGNFIDRSKLTIKDFFLSFKNPQIIRAMVNTSLFSGFYKAVKDYLQPILKTLALSLPILIFLKTRAKRVSLIIGLLYFFIYILSSFASRSSGPFSKKFHNLSLPLNLSIILGFVFGILSGIFYFLGVQYKNSIFYILTVVFFLCIYLIENLRKPMGIAQIGNQLKKNILATSLSATSQIQSLFSASFSIILGFLIDKIQLGPALILVSISLVVLYPIYALKSTKL